MVWGGWPAKAKFLIRCGRAAAGAWRGWRDAKGGGFWRRLVVAGKAGAEAWRERVRLWM